MGLRCRPRPTRLRQLAKLAVGRPTPFRHPTVDLPLTMFYDGVSIGNRTFDANTDEASDICRSQRPENVARKVLWFCVDAVNYKIWAISGVNAAAMGAWTLTGAGVAAGSAGGPDMEAMASATVNGVPYIYLGATGNNNSTANYCGTGVDVAIYRIVEPYVTGSDGSTTDFIRIDCVYPAGNLPTSKDAEVMLVDPLTGKIYIVTKRDSTAKLYSLAHAATYSGIQTLVFEGNITTPATITQNYLGSSGGYYVGGDISPDGRQIVIKSYPDVYHWTRQDAGKTSIATTLAGAATTIEGYVGLGKPSASGAQPGTFPQNEPQGEGICFDWEGRSLYSISEGGDFSSVADTALTNALDACPVFKYTRVPAAVTQVTFQDGVSGYTGTQDCYIQQDLASTNFNGTTMTVDDNQAAATTKLGLLKFDISSIPAGSKIVGCDLYLNIAVEGQDFGIFKCYVAWAETTSTYANVNGGNGILQNDVDSASVADAQQGAPNNAQANHGNNAKTGWIRCKIPIATIQDWLNGTLTNNGWVLVNNGEGADGTQFNTSDHGTASLRPILVVRYQ